MRVRRPSGNWVADACFAVSLARSYAVLPDNDKGLHCCNPLVLLVGRAGIEPATNGLRESGPNRDHFSNQTLATHAKFQEQPCTAWSEPREGMQSSEIATLAIVDVNPIA